MSEETIVSNDTEAPLISDDNTSETENENQELINTDETQEETKTEDEKPEDKEETEEENEDEVEEEATDEEEDDEDIEIGDGKTLKKSELIQKHKDIEKEKRAIAQVRKQSIQHQSVNKKLDKVLNSSLSKIGQVLDNLTMPPLSEEQIKGITDVNQLKQYEIERTKNNQAIEDIRQQFISEVNSGLGTQTEKPISKDESQVLFDMAQTFALQDPDKYYHLFNKTDAVETWNRMNETLKKKGIPFETRKDILVTNMDPSVIDMMLDYDRLLQAEKGDKSSTKTSKKPVKKSANTNQNRKPTAKTTGPAKDVTEFTKRQKYRDQKVKSGAWTEAQGSNYVNSGIVPKRGK